MRVTRALPLAFAAAPLLMLPGPARADWAPTRWGMSVDEVVAAYSGAKAVKHNPKQDTGETFYLLAQGEYRDGPFKLRAEFFFDATSRRLGKVFLNMPDKKKCQDYRRSLIARWGMGKPTVTEEFVQNVRVGTALIEWTDPQSGDALSYVEVAVGIKYITCHLVIAKPAAA